MAAAEANLVNSIVVSAELVEQSAMQGHSQVSSQDVEFLRLP